VPCQETSSCCCPQYSFLATDYDIWDTASEVFGTYQQDLHAE
jgi:hypothetical protein